MDLNEHALYFFATNIIKNKPQITLLSVSPMAKINSGSDNLIDSDRNNEDEITSFTAEAHVNHFKKVFEIFGIQDH